MEIIELPWEINNIGAKSIEYRIDLKDEPEEIEKTVLSEKEYEYQTVRLPVGNMQISSILEKGGFRFSETAFELVCDLRYIRLPEQYQKITEHLAYHEATATEINDVETRIRNGIFENDRIALDPYFSKKISANRYGNWFRQEINNGTTKCYIVKCDAVPAGFFAIKERDPKTADSFLAALFDPQSNMGMGFSVLYFPLCQAKAEEKKKMTTRVSSNNPVSLKTHLELGYKIKNMHYIFTRHV